MTERILRMNALIIDTAKHLEDLLDSMPQPDASGITQKPLGARPVVDNAAFDKEFGAAPANIVVPYQDAFEGLGHVISDTFGLANEQAQVFAGMMSSTFGQVAAAIGDAVHAYVLFGTAGGASKTLLPN